MKRKFFYILPCYIFVYWTTISSNNIPTTLFCHGIVDNHTQMERHKQALTGLTQSFDFPDAETAFGWNLNNAIYQMCHIFGKTVNREKMYMGQGKDIQTIHDHIDQHKTYILYGLSRGGSAAINYLAHYNPTNIQALVLDSAPADMVASIENFQRKVGYQFISNRATQEILFHQVFPAYPLYSTPPVQAIKDIVNTNLPVLIIHSQQDQQVSITAAWQIYLSFIRSGFTNVYLCQLATGKHGYYLQGADKKTYLAAVHSFYKKYQLPYNQDFAHLDLTTLQPTEQEIQKKLDDYTDASKRTSIANLQRIQQKLLYLGIGTLCLTGIVLLNTKNK